MNNQILRLAIPNIISNITVPLLGMVDIAIAGHLSSVLYIGAISLGTTIFNMIYWNFNFLRMGTGGFTAQAYGAGNNVEMANLLFRSLLIALSIGFLIILLQYPIFQIAGYFIKTENETVVYLRQYFNIVVWSAPATLSMYAFNGWFIGMQDSKTPMYVAIVNNVLNIVLSFIFVVALRMQIKGIALGTTISQIVAALLFVVIWKRSYFNEMKSFIQINSIFDGESYKNFFRVNIDIFIRTFLLVTVTTFFTFASTGMGSNVLAVNALLMQFFMLFSYFMDGFAYAGEALTGKYIGRKDYTKLTQTIKYLFAWGASLAVLAALAYILLTPQILSIFTDKTEIISLAKKYIIWIALIPIASFSTFVWDGIYVGATASAGMRNSMIVAVAIFFTSYYWSTPVSHNNGLWLSFILYLFGRSVMQTVLYKRALKIGHLYHRT